MSVVQVLAQPTAMLDDVGRIVACNVEFQTALTGSDELAPYFSLMKALRPAECDRIEAYFNERSSGSHLAKIELAPGHFNLVIDGLDAPDGTRLHLCQLTPDRGIESTRLRFLLEHLDQGVWNYNVLSETFTVTEAWRRMRDLPDDYDINDPKQKAGKWLDPIHPDDRAKVQHFFLGQISGAAETVNVQYRYRKSGGEWIWILSRTRVMTKDHRGLPVQIIGLDTDITTIKNNEIAHQELANKMQLAIDVAGIGVWEYNASNKEVHWDDRVLEIYGLTDGQNLRADTLWETYLHPDDREETARLSDECALTNKDFQRDFRIVTPDGDVRYVRSVSQMVDTAGKRIGVNLDVTEDYRRTEELEAARELLEHDSKHDALTGLANRRLLDDTTFAMLQRLGPNDNFAVLHIDLDHFKEVNDGLGHAAGDRVLVYVADVLRHHVGDQGLVCRIGGDEFVVLLDDFRSIRQVRELCNGLIEVMKSPIGIEGQHCTVGLSIGCAIGQGGVTDAAEVFLNADVALYAAKSDGRSCYKFFDDGMRPVSRAEGSGHHSLRMAMEEGQLICYFQPQFDAKTFEMVGAEALVRWNCPVRGVIPPDEFLPLARSTGLAPHVDEYVFEYVLQMQTEWANAGLEVPLVALNICLDRLLDPSFLKQVQNKVRPHHAIGFELLETAFLDDCNDAVMVVLDSLREVGIRIDLDDFGSGHSSVVALQSVRPDRVKLDRLLVAPLEVNPAQIHILNALVCVARLEGCGVVVEGIETQQQLEALVAIDIEAVQGYLLGRPQSAAEFARQLVPCRRSAGA